MKKFGLVVLGITAGIIAVANLGSLLALALSAAIAYAGFHYFRKSESTVAKLFWGVVLLMACSQRFRMYLLLSGSSRFSVSYMHGVNGKAQKITTSSHNVSDDPFVNFERQWDEITK